MIQLVNMLTRKVTRTLRVLPLSNGAGGPEGGGGSGVQTTVAAGPLSGAQGGVILGVDPRLGQLMIGSANGSLDFWDAVKARHVATLVAQARNVVSSAAVSGDKKALVRACAMG